MDDKVTPPSFKLSSQAHFSDSDNKYSVHANNHFYKNIRAEIARLYKLYKYMLN